MKPPSAQPATRRYLAVHIEAIVPLGEIGCIIFYLVDRLDRSFADFCKIIEVFEMYEVSFMSVTQHFYTINLMGRLPGAVGQFGTQCRLTTVGPCETGQLGQTRFIIGWAM